MEISGDSWTLFSSLFYLRPDNLMSLGEKRIFLKNKKNP